MPTIRLPFLKESREAKGWTLTILAATAGVSHETTTKADSAEPVSFRTAQKLAAALGGPVEALTGQKTLGDLGN